MNKEQVVLGIRVRAYVIPAESTRPSPVIPTFGAPSPVPSAVDRHNARLFLKLKREAAAVELGVFG